MGYPAVASAGIAIGAVLALASLQEAADAVWAATVATMLVPLSWSVARALLAGRLGVDLIALLAMVGALALGEYLAGAVIALMLAGGNALEAYRLRAGAARADGACSSARHDLRDAAQTAAGRRSTSSRSSSTMSCWCAPARCCPTDGVVLGDASGDRRVELDGRAAARDATPPGTSSRAEP